jgi:uncharacterized membrane-anchored protein YitT (DUF2179 family)
MPHLIKSFYSYKNILFIIIGAWIFAIGINLFIIPAQLSEGGVTGIAILLKYSLDISPSITTLVLNIPLFIIGWRTLGKKAMAYTILGTVSLSFFLWLTDDWPFPEPSDPLLNVLYAGVTVGIGLGIIFRYGGTTGGVDIIARLCNKLFGWSIGRTIFAVDVMVIGASAFVLDINKVLYTLVAVFVGSRVIDFIIEGAYASKAAMIISDRAPEIADKVMNELERGSTLLKGKGAYTGSDKEVLYCVVYRAELMRLTHIVKSIDPRAFIVVSRVSDVLGEGFRED